MFEEEEEFELVLTKADEAEREEERVQILASRKKASIGHNRREPKTYKYKDELLTVKAIAKRVGLSNGSIRARLNTGWKVREILEGGRTTVTTKRKFGEDLPIKHNFF